MSRDISYLLDILLYARDARDFTAGMDDKHSWKDVTRKELEDNIRKCHPKVLCFNGKRAAKAFLRKKHVEYGYQKETIGSTLLFAVPSTSGAARGYWDQTSWEKLSEEVHKYRS